MESLSACESVRKVYRVLCEGVRESSECREGKYGKFTECLCERYESLECSVKAYGKFRGSVKAYGKFYRVPVKEYQSDVLETLLTKDLPERRSAKSGKSSAVPERVRATRVSLRQCLSGVRAKLLSNR
ncbi:hypothetical protein AVEN_192580-1 [Araneus ventricosus]|uniref:Uncharacterized protein n=1 Tax=Araneus ventricosus TaxID=182803 RepID=A0A4Y2TQK9_ARAVE|nr:hypothetical protein AVEN_192580-1 [Araneus ventricosus]